jgi:hypothetical protein
VFKSLLLGGFEPFSVNPHLHIIVKIKIKTSAGWISTYAMIDSGASASFIDQEFVKSKSLPTNTKSSPFKVSLADGKLAQQSLVSHESLTELSIGQHRETLALNVTKISYPVMLGIDWLKAHDPWIHWSSHQVTFNSRYCNEFCQVKHSCTVTSVNYQPKESEAEENKLECNAETILRTVLPPRNPRVVSRNQVKGTNPVRETADKPEPKAPAAIAQEKQLECNAETILRTVLPPRNPRVVSRNQVKGKFPVRDPTDKVAPAAVSRVAPAVSMINAVAFGRHLKNPTCEVFQVSINEITNPTPNEGPDLSKIPAEYRDFADVFSKEAADKLPEHRPYDHTIALQEGTSPPFGPVYPLSPTELDVLKKYIDENLRKGFIRHSQSPAGAPILFVKKPDGTLRLCVDYRGLNNITIKNKYPLPLIGELLDRVGKAKRFTKLDMRDGYHRLRMAEGEEWKTAMRCRYGLYEFCVMPFGLCNAPGSFQHFANDIFKDFLDDFLVVYLDDLLIYSNTRQEHKRHVRLVLQRLREAGLFLKLEKSVFNAEEVPFLGFIISPDGTRMDPSKVDAITSWPEPKSPHDIQVFLGLANFYRRFVKGYSKIVAPLTDLLKKGVKFHWSKAQKVAFSSLKKAFTTAPILRHFDPSKPAIVETDASDEAFGGALSQVGEDGLLHPCAFVSKKFSDTQRNYEIYDKEMFAIVECMYHHWRHYLEGSGLQATVVTDHKNLLWFTETKIYTRRHARWAEKLSRFDFVIKFRPGAQSGLPDALSRRPGPQGP